MILEMAGGLVSGGWDALTNITSGIGKGISRIGSTFFPGPQQVQPIVSEITQAGNYTSTPKPVSPDAPSTWETLQMAANQWLRSPYEDQYAALAKTQEGLNLEQKISAVEPEKEPGLFENIFTGLEWAATQSRNIRTLADELMAPWSPRDTVYGKPQAGYPEGRDEGHLNNLAQAGANMWEAMKVGAGAMLDQVKGLFNIGFPQQESQPGFGLTHEIKPSKGLSAGLIIAGIVIVLVILLSRKK